MSSFAMLSYLEIISNQHLGFNLISHLVIYLLLLSLIVFRKKDCKCFKIIQTSTIGLLLLFVIINALYYGNPFHLITFLLMLILGIIFQCTAKLENKSVAYFGTPSKAIFSVISLLFMFVGIWYPEFVKVNLAQSLLFSPLGIVPCPTILVTLGFMNLKKELFSRKTIITIIVFAFVYGIIGTLIFEVRLDIALLMLAVFSIINLAKKN